MVATEHIAQSALDYLLLEIARETPYATLEQIGYRIGYNLVEKYARIM
jgi:hypothetical protein